MPGRFSPWIVTLLWLGFSSIAAVDVWQHWNALNSTVTAGRIYSEASNLEMRVVRVLVGTTEVARMVSSPHMIGNEQLVVNYVVTGDTSNLSRFTNIPFLNKITIPSTHLDIEGSVIYDVARENLFLSGEFRIRINEVKGHLLATRQRNELSGADDLEIWINWPGETRRHVVPWEQCPLISFDPMASLAVPWLTEGETWALSTFDFMAGTDHRFLATAREVGDIDIWGRKMKARRIVVEDDNKNPVAEAWVTAEGKMLRCIFVNLLTIETVETVET